MLQHQRLELVGRDLLAAAVDHVLDPAHHHEVPGRLTPDQITGPVVTVGGERGGGRAAVVGGDHAGAPGDQLADRAGGDRDAVRIHHERLVPGGGGPAL